MAVAFMAIAQGQLAHQAVVSASGPHPSARIALSTYTTRGRNVLRRPEKCYSRPAKSTATSLHGWIALRRPADRTALRLKQPAATAAIAIAIAAPSASASLPQLVLAAAVPVTKVALFCAVGAWAARRGLLPPAGRRLLSGLTLAIFTPCLLFSKLAAGGGLAELRAAWLLTANMAASHVVGLLLGLLACRLVRVPPRLRAQLLLACGVGNVGNLPFVLLAGLAGDPGLPFAAALGAGAAVERAMRYVALSNLSAALIQFPLTYIFLQKPPPADDATATAAPPQHADQQVSGSERQHPRRDEHPQREQDTTARAQTSTGTTHSSNTHDSCNARSSDRTSAVLPNTAPSHPCPHTATAHCQPGPSSVADTTTRSRSAGTHASATTTGPTSPHVAASPPPGSPTSSSSALQSFPPAPSATSLPAPASGAKPYASCQASRPAAWRVRWRALLAGVFTPPTCASLAAVGVASVDACKHALFHPTGCLRLLGEVADALGAVCIPALLLVLGANLAHGPAVSAGGPTHGSVEDQAGGGEGLSAAAVVAAAVTRLLVLPAVCGAALWGAWRAGLLPGTDPLALLVMLLMHATPTAVLVHSMAVLFRNEEDAVATLLFWQYAACLVTLPLAIAAMLRLLGPVAARPEAWLGGQSGVVAAAVAVAVDAVKGGVRVTG